MQTTTLRHTRELPAPFAAPSRWRRRRLAARFRHAAGLGAARLGRAAEALLAATCLLLILPVLAPAALASVRAGGGVRRTLRVGKGGAHFVEYGLEPGRGPVWAVLGALCVPRWPALANILLGQMAFVGPRAVAPGELSPRHRPARRRYDVRPGLICLWWLRRRANIAYGSEAEADGEYVDGRSAWGDLGIALRALPATLYGPEPATTEQTVHILGLPIDNVTMDEAVAALLRAAAGKGTPAQACFVNADCANLAFRDRAYRRVLEEAGFCLADGIGMKLAGRIVGRPIRQNVNGTDLFPRLCAALATAETRVFLLGARPGVAQAVGRWIEAHHPGLVVCGCRHGYFAPEEEDAVVAEVAGARPDVLLVALGAPRQDTFVARHLPRTGARLAAGVGGLLDFYGGGIPRAPLWMRELGLEWAYRLNREPRRLWRRYVIGNGVFLFRVAVEALRERWRREDGEGSTGHGANAGTREAGRRRAAAGNHFLHEGGPEAAHRGDA